MKKLFYAVIVAIAVVGGPVAFSTFYEQPAKAEGGVRMDPSQLMMGAKNLPAADLVDYSVVFN